MRKGSKNIRWRDRRDRLLVENPGLPEKIRALLVEAAGTNVEPPCLVWRTRSKRTEYDWAKDPKGVYRLFRIRSGGRWKWEYVHRLVYILHYGGIPDGYEVCHLCHNRSCARIEHLWSATQNTHRGKAGLDTRFRSIYLPILQKSQGKMIITTAVPQLQTNPHYLGYIDLGTGRMRQGKRR